MAKSVSTGACFLCSQPFSKSSISRHLAKCLDAHAESGSVKPTKAVTGFLITVDGKYQPDYWLSLEARADCTFADLDDFLRRIWLECCGHLSAFRETGKRATPTSIISMLGGGYDDFHAPGEIDMDLALGRILQPKKVLEYDYDFGSTTSLRVKTVAARTVTLAANEQLRLVARNHAPTILCGVCEKSPAVKVDPELAYEPDGWLCRSCFKKRRVGFALPVLNSPRTGECAYSGSSLVDLGGDVLQKALAVTKQR